MNFSINWYKINLEVDTYHRFCCKNESSAVLFEYRAQSHCFDAQIAIVLWWNFFVDCPRLDKVHMLSTLSLMYNIEEE